MEIKCETKYNIGDVLYHMNGNTEIEKKVIKSISVIVEKDRTGVRYYFTDNRNDTEIYMKYYSKDINEVAKMIAEHAIELFKISHK